MRKLLTVLTCVIIACFSFLLVGCTPTSTGDVCERLLEKGYEIEAYYIKNTNAEDEIGLDIDIEGGAYSIEGYKETPFTERLIYVFVFDEASDAKKIYDEFKGDIEEIIGDDGVIEQNGKVLVLATKSAYEDYKG